jgi:HEAT repeat protein
MAGCLGRVLVGGRDRGAGFALGPQLVITANHVVRDRKDQSVVYMPAGSEAVGVERIQVDVGHDAAVLWLVDDVEFLPASVAVRGAGWRVESPPTGKNDPQLHGTVTTARMAIHNASGERVEVVQLEVDEQLGDFGGYSGSAVLDVVGRAVLALLVEQKPLRTPVGLGERQAASNVLYAVPIDDVITANSLPVQTSLKPLAGQLTLEESHEQVRQVGSRISELDAKVDTALRDRRWELPYRSDRQLITAQERRHEANGWCAKVLGSSEIDFWEADWRQRLHAIVDPAQSLALTARGGSGKSVLAAHLVRYLLQQDPYSCPIVLNRPDDLRNGMADVRKRAGVGSAAELSRYVNGMRSAGHRVLFVIDGLDSLIGATSTSSVASIIQELANLSCLLVTCRTELWEQAFSHLSIEQQLVEPLSEEVVRQVLHQHTRFRSWRPAVLRLPFYLNAALLLNADYIELPTTETGLLEGLLKRYDAPPGAALPRWYSFEPLFLHLAELQLAVSSYEVPRTELLAAAWEVPHVSEVVAHLESTGVLWRHITAGQLTVRLNHDLLDCFNMARLLIAHEAARQQRELVYGRAADLAGWTVLSMLAQISHDDGNERLLRELFNKLLGMLDRKKFGERWMGRSWAATYIIRDKVNILMPLVLECLDGQQAESLRDPAASGGSCLGPDASVTQEAASSLASAFDALDDWRDGLPKQAIPVLSRGLQRWQLRKRFVEALSKYRDSAAVEALRTLARNQLGEGGDTQLLGEIAEAMGRMGAGLAETGKRACAEILTDIVANPRVDARVRRAAIEAKNELTRPIVEAVPEIAEAEIITYLDPVDHERGSYSDWRVVQRYAGYAYKRIMNGQLSQPLLSALLQAFTHEQLYARTAVASCLGQADDPAARAALITELLGPSPSWDVQEACLEALDTQIREAKGPAQRALRRWLVLEAADEAARSGAPAAAALADLASKSWGANEPIVTTGAFEVVPVAADAGSVPSITLLQAEAPPVVEWIRDLISPGDYSKAGPGREPKYRMVSVARPDRTRLAVTAARTTWEEGASFHCAMLRRAPVLRESADRILSAWLGRTANFPGIASVHCIVLTSDRKIVKAQRGANTLYSAGRWSVSFEEQITTVDFESLTYDPATAAALRGFGEEFHLSPESCRAQVVSAVIEFPITNLSLIVVIETDEISHAFRSNTRSADIATQEIAEVDFIDATPDQLLAEIERPNLHPTSAIRVRVLSRLYGWGRT